jgi:hypothetical protein
MLGSYFLYEKPLILIKKLKMDLDLSSISQENETLSSILVWFINFLKLSFNIGSSFSFGNQTTFWSYVT